MVADGGPPPLFVDGGTTGVLEREVATIPAPEVISTTPAADGEAAAGAIGACTCGLTSAAAAAAKDDVRHLAA